MLGKTGEVEQAKEKRDAVSTGFEGEVDTPISPCCTNQLQKLHRKTHRQEESSIQSQDTVIRPEGSGGETEEIYTKSGGNGKSDLAKQNKLCLMYTSQKLVVSRSRRLTTRGRNSFAMKCALACSHTASDIVPQMSMVSCWRCWRCWREGQMKGRCIHPTELIDLG